MPLGPLAPELVRATTFALPSAEMVRAVGMGEQPGEFYPRYGHPAGRRFEAGVAELEGADGAVAFASGMAVIHALFGTFCSAGDVVCAANDLYGGVSSLLRNYLPRLGITVRRFDPFDLKDMERTITGKVRLVHVETPINPTVRVVDLARVARVAKAAGALLSCDATFVPPPFQQVLRHGVDLAMHSATKFLGGHSDVLAGVVSGRHELVAQMEGFRRLTGAVLGPDAAWLLCRSLPTHVARVRQQTATARELAGFLRERSGRVARVHYSGLPDHPDHAVAQRQMEGFGSVLSFEVPGGAAGAIRVYDRLKVIARAVSLGGVESVASLPIHTSHAHATAEERQRAGIGEGLIRLSVGLEPGAVLRADLEQALA